MSILKEITHGFEIAALAAAINTGDRMPPVLSQPLEVEVSGRNTGPRVDSTHRNTSTRPNQIGPAV